MLLFHPLWKLVNRERKETEEYTHPKGQCRDKFKVAVKIHNIPRFTLICSYSTWGVLGSSLISFNSMLAPPGFGTALPAMARQSVGLSEMKTSFKFPCRFSSRKGPSLYRYYVRKRSCSIYSEGQSMVPSLMPSMTSWGSMPSTVQPTDWAVPSTSFMVPENSLAMDLRDESLYK